MAADTVQVVTASGDFNDGFEGFVQRSRVAESGTDYQVVAITGPQSSGKSTLMNILFGTRFEEMDAFSGRVQTTKGIWMASSPKVLQPATLVLDLEGSDGRERGEDDNSFERQSSLFALAVADVLIVNMWAKDVGREAGSGKPLLKTIFQVNLKLFTPDPHKERTVLLFVFRDKTKTPLDRLIATWEEDLHTMWTSFTKPQQYADSKFTDFFEMLSRRRVETAHSLTFSLEVKYSSLPNFEDREEEFLAESVLLRRRFTEEDDDSLVRRGHDKLPGHVLPMSLKNIWEIIKDQKDLNLPAHKVMVANIRCGEIMREKLDALRRTEAFLDISQLSGTQLLPQFGALATELIRASLAGYDEEAGFFEVGVRASKRAELAQALYSEFQPAFVRQLALLSNRCLATAKADIAKLEADPSSFAKKSLQVKGLVLEDFATQSQSLLVEGVGWEVTAAVADLQADIEGHVERIIASKVAEAVQNTEKQLAKALSGPLIALLDSCPPDLWLKVNRLLSSVVPKHWQVLLASVKGYGLSEDRLELLKQQLEVFAKARVAAHFQEAANTAMARMKDRFRETFTRDESALPRRWGPRDSIIVVMHKAYQDAALLLSQLAVLRIGKPQSAHEVVDASIRELVAGEVAPLGTGTSKGEDEADSDFDVRSAADWPGVTQESVLLSPPECRQLWRQLTSDSQLVVQQAQATQEANRAASNKMPPLWAIGAMLVLGFNEFMALLYNPLWLLFLIAVLLFAKTVYTELDIDAELEAGLLPGLLSIMHKFMPTVTAVSQRTVQRLLSVAQEQSSTVSDSLGLHHNAKDQAAESSEKSTATASGVSEPGNKLRHRTTAVGQ